MKKFKSIFIYTLMLAGAALYSCEGPAGKDGKDGLNGEDGIDGATGTAQCQVCHNDDQWMAEKVGQYNQSFHAGGENAAYANNSSAACTQCHVSQGFVDYIKNGKVSNVAKYSDPLQPNCYTCHKVHQTYTESDWTLTTTAAVVLTHGGQTFDKGKGNLCANCHQGRALTPALPSVGGTDVTLSSSQTRWGLHHGPMANILLGKGGYEVVGTKDYSSTPHAHYAQTANACVTCHMATPYGTMAGGHQLGLEYDSHGTAKMLTTGCTACHTNATTLATLISTRQATTQSLLDQLEAKLITAGIYNSTTGLANAGTYSADVAGAYINWLTIKEDKSLGIHNPTYTEALLQNSIEKLP